MNNKPTILLTGATGFIGSNLLQLLLVKNYQVICLVRHHNNVPSKAQVNITIDELENFALSNRIDIVIHLATFFCADKFPDEVNTQKIIDSNIQFTSKLASTLRSINPELILYSESAAQYLNQSQFPNFYSFTKSIGCKIIEYYLPQKTKLLKLVFPDTYGIADPRPKLFTLLRKSLQEGSILELSEGHQILNYLYVDDVIDGIIFAIEKVVHEKKTSLFRLRSPEVYTLRNIIEKFEKISDQKLEIVWGAKPYRDSDVFNDSGYPEDLPGWEPKISLEEGIKKIILG
jgi:nucleoside-diphosphate-sugar epimerase